VDDYYSVEKFKAAYAGYLPTCPAKCMWPEATHGFFMHPPLLKSTAGRRKNRVNHVWREVVVAPRKQGKVVANISAQFVGSWDTIGTLARMGGQKI
jgi:hypothetical protein